MNIYQEVYNIIKTAKEQWYEIEVNPFKAAPHHVLIEDDETEKRKWTFVAKYLQQHASEEIIKVAKEKYPILQQIFQNNESEVRS